MGLWKSGTKQRYSEHAAKFHSLLNHKGGTIYTSGLQFSQSINYFPRLFSFTYFLILLTSLSPMFPDLGLHPFFIFPLISISVPLTTFL